MSFGGFNFVTDGDKPAVVANGDTAANQLGYDNVSSVLIAHIRVTVNNVVVFDDVVVDGKYRSAVWVEAMLAYRGCARYERTELVIDDVAYFTLRGYMGRQVCQQALETRGQSHPFVYAILATEGMGSLVLVEVTWK